GWTVVNMPGRISSNWISCIFAAADGSIWFGIQNSGLARLDNGEWTTYEVGSVSCLLETTGKDGAHTLWAGTNNGLARFAQNHWTTISAKSGLPDNNVLCLLATAGQDGAPALWVGTYRGLARFERDQWTTFQVSADAANNLVTSLAE